jgi:hypothetical protein
MVTKPQVQRYSTESGLCDIMRRPQQNHRRLRQAGFSFSEISSCLSTRRCGSHRESETWPHHTLSLRGAPAFLDFCPTGFRRLSSNLGPLLRR